MRAPQKPEGASSSSEPFGGGGETELLSEFEEDFDRREDGGAESPNSARTADEQMDYLESLEPCPCYAKCCIDSVITLFCVTLLG